MIIYNFNYFKVLMHTFQICIINAPPLTKYQMSPDSITLSGRTCFL